MAFLALASQKSMLGLQKNFLVFQQTSISNQVQAATAQMATIQREYSQMKDADGQTPDYTEDADYIYFDELNNQLQTEKESIESQITAIDSELGSLKTLVNSSIKSSCTLNLASGS
ncbi:MAG: hypothetical protein NC191_07920 [Muribaculaceae bacterium]|nr:hypothetical protein [Muribaculaceae bacterium]